LISEKTLGIIFSNMHDHMLSEITEPRTMGSVPLGGRYRLIDFVLSNMVNSGISDVGVITKSNYQSLIDHLGTGREWDLSRKRGGLSLLPPFGHSSAGIYRGRLEALSGVVSFIHHSDAKYVLMADCDIVANIDFTEIFKTHIEKKADITVAYKRDVIGDDQAADSTVLRFDDQGMVNEVLIHPNNIQGEDNVYLNFCLISKELLEKEIHEGTSRNIHSFLQGVLQAKCNRLHIASWEFKGYSAKVNSIRKYYRANMAMLEPQVRAQLFPRERPIYTKVRDEVPAKYGLNAKATGSMVADGAIIEGTLENSIVFRGVHVGKNAVVKNCILMQDTVVSESVTLDHVITDKNVVVREGRTLVGYETYPLVIAKNSIV
jgi:glucose-1-phosphate adenylyltransferase